MYFITNKAVQKQNNRLVFPDHNSISEKLLYCRRHHGHDREFKEIGNKRFLHEVMSDEAGEVLFYIHGFNNQPYDKVFPRAEKIKEQLVHHDLSHVEVVPIIWPSDNDPGIIRDYFDDQEWAARSAPYFSEMISLFSLWRAKTPDRKKLHVLAHSMGSRVLMKTMAHWAERQGAKKFAALFENIFLMASDIPNESLEKEQEGYHITTAGKKVFVYHALDDIALASSNISNIKNGVLTRRIGQAGPESMDKTPHNVYAVNCNAFNYDFDKHNGHSYFFDLVKDGKRIENPVFAHITQAIKSTQIDLSKREIKLAPKATT